MARPVDPPGDHRSDRRDRALSSPAFRPPYRFAFVVLAVTLLLDIYSGNHLWRNYTLVGFGILFAIIGLERHTGARIPAGAAWMGGVTASFHYLGGSFSGLHTTFGINGLYYVFPWWDNVTHALGSAAVAVAGFALLAQRLHRPHRGQLVFLGVCIASFLGVLVELYEFAGFLFFGTVDQGFYTNTVLDLYYNVLGGLIGATFYAVWLHPRDAHDAARNQRSVQPASTGGMAEDDRATRETASMPGPTPSEE